MDISLGQFIKEARTPLNISMRKLATIIGVSPGYISQIERDLCSPPTEATLVKLADALSLNRSHVMSRVGKIPRVIIEGFVAFPEEVEAAEKYFSEKLSAKKAQAQNADAPLN